MKARLLEMQLKSDISPDSLRPAVERLEAMARQTRDDALRAVCYAVLSQLYDNDHSLSEQWQTLSNHYKKQALEHPERLAQVVAKDYVPLVIEAADDDIFNHELLGIIGRELGAWNVLQRYYDQVGNRRAACISALHQLQATQHAVPGNRATDKPWQTCPYVARYDSLLSRYADLAEAGEVAIARYDCMNECHDTPIADLIAYIDQAVRQWPNWKRISQLQATRSQLTNPQFTIDIAQRTVLPQQTQQLQLREVRHLAAVTLRIYRTNLKGNHRLYLESNADYKKIKSGLTELTALRQTKTFATHHDYEMFSDSLLLPALSEGVYMLEVSGGNGIDTKRMLYHVSNLRAMAFSQPNKTLRIIVVNATTGQPIEGARVQVTDDNKIVSTLTTNKQGETSGTFSRGRWLQGYVSTATDQSLPPFSLSNTYYVSTSDKVQTIGQVFTDRAIYRPGETVHAAAIVYQLTDGVSTSAVANHQLSARLYDANGTMLEEKTATTDAFGKCTADFTLPTNRLTGNYRVAFDQWRTSFRVEEYKRPTFEVNFRDNKQAYQVGDTLRLTADVKAYAGVTLVGAKVSYRVERSLPYWWRMCRWSGQGNDDRNQLLVDSVTTTMADGTFCVSVPLVVDSAAQTTPRFYSFMVTADVTDANGETQRATTRIPLGTRASWLTCDLAQQVRADQLTTITFARRNAAGQPLDGRVRYRFDKGAWHETTANVATDVKAWQLKSGSHQLQAICEGDTIRQSTVVFSLADRRPATATHDWFYVSSPQFPHDGSPVTLQVGSSDDNLYIAYEICAGDNVLEKGAWRENKSLRNLQLTYQPTYGDGIVVAVAWVKNGVTYQHTAAIKRPVEDKRLTMTWKTFRNRLLPGQQEEWQLTIAEPDGRPANAQVMATIYDKSLEQLARHQWSLQPAERYMLPYCRWMTVNTDNIWRFSSARNTVKYPEPLQFGHIDTSLYPTYGYRNLRMRGGNGMVLMERSMAAAPMGAMMAKRKESVAQMDGAALEESATVAYDTVDEMPQEPETDLPPLRTNLEATAYFAPQLATDSTGTVSLRFTLPEALTTWRVMALAHTPEIHVGMLTDEVVAQKQLMLQPNMPRFIRTGDEAQIAARLSNLSESTLSGQVMLRLTDAETGEVVMTEKQSFTMEKAQTAVVAFRYRPDGSQSLLICQMVANAQGHSDGEQHYLPILPECERVTTTVPITQHASGTQTIMLSKLFPSGTKQQRLTIEYTNRPAWLMVQSLASQQEARETNAIDQAAMLYVNLLTQHLVASNPQIEGVVEQWKRETAEEKTLDANLAKDQSLKNLLLEETPWMMEAKSEQAQRQALANLFDATLIGQRTASASEQLGKLQQSNGGFAWYGGMQSSRYVTISVAEMLARLQTMTGTKSATQPLLQRAMHYLDDEVAKTVEQLKREERRKHPVAFPSTTELQWLYVNAITQRTLSAKAKESSRYLTTLLKKETKRQTIYEKALTAVVLQQQGQRQLAATYAQSLKEYSVYSEEVGRYYDTPRATYSWQSYKIPTEVAAIEALRLIMPSDGQTIDEMRRWLLQEKRTQQWDTPLNTINAIYAFVDGTSALAPSKVNATIAIDGQEVEMTDATAGMGYQKTTIDHPTGQTLTIAKTTNDTSWGAVYAQYMQPSKDISTSTSGIKVTREVVDAKKTYQVGDRIKVRITIQSSRDLDFVQVVDRKAACMEPVNQLSGYSQGAYCAPRDGATHYFFDQLSKGKHVIETEYFIDRQGCYTTGTCTVQCAYAPEFRATCSSMSMIVK